MTKTGRFWGRWAALLVVLLLAVPGAVHAAGELRFADLGDVTLENGQTIKDCRLGYRTFGALSKDRSNALLFPCWLAGTSADLVKAGLIGPGKMADTDRYFVIAVDSLGNGVSSSPSLSERHPDRPFPEYTIRDMVLSQYLLLTRHLDLKGLHAVVGISMGGMQAFQWLHSYPGFVRKAVSIVGSPRLTSGDLLLFAAELRAIAVAGTGPEGEVMGRKTLTAIHAYATRNPNYYLRNLPCRDVPAFLAGMEKSLERYHLDDWAWQLKAIMKHDVLACSDNIPDKTGGTAATRIMVVVARDDLLVNPEPALAYARDKQGEILELMGGCGHFSFLCEAGKVSAAVAVFLNRKD